MGPHHRDKSGLGSTYWGPPILGNYHMGFEGTIKAVFSGGCTRYLYGLRPKLRFQNVTPIMENQMETKMLNGHLFYIVICNQ